MRLLVCFGGHFFMVDNFVPDRLLWLGLFEAVESFVGIWIRPVLLKLSLPRRRHDLGGRESDVHSCVSGTRWERHPKRGSASIEIVRQKSDLV
jgi:hypothetical protein